MTGFIGGVHQDFSSAMPPFMATPMLAVDGRHAPPRNYHLTRRISDLGRD
jgi:hypothetical protein